MIEIGRINRLQVSDQCQQGVYLDGGEKGPVLLASDSANKRPEPGDFVDVFVYRDKKAGLIATHNKPGAMVGEFAWLTVVSLTDVGAFLDWGLDKDLLLPYGQQRHELSEGQKVLVRVFVDEHTQRIAASARIDDFLREEATGFVVGQAVDLLITGQTELGFKAIVDNSHWGILYKNELFQPVAQGQRIGGFIKKIRSDKKIDLTLYQPGYASIAPVCEKVISRLKEHDGFMMITDKSSPETIYALFKVSKKVYKKAIGALYKQRRITIEQQGIRLAEK